MRTIPGLAFVLAATLAAAACGPVYRLEYHYFTPEYREVRECVADCRGAERSCRQRAPAAQVSEYEKCSERAYAEYSNCRRARRPGQDAGTCYRPVCVVAPGGEPPQRCEQAFQECYEDCGGTIEVRKVCEARC